MNSDSTGPLVSAVIPAYNAERFISDAIESVFAQTYPHIEVVVVDDGSTDGTSDVLAPYESASRVRVFRQANAGPAAARNRGIEESKGKYIAFLDADDLWVPTKTEKQVGLFRQSPELGLVYSLGQGQLLDDTGRWIEDARSRWLWADRTYRRGPVFREIVSTLFILLPSVIVPKGVLEEVGGFSSDLQTAEDRHLYARIAHDYAIDYVPEPLVIIRRHGANISWDPAREPQTLDFLRKIADEFPECSLRESKWMRSTYASWAHASAREAFHEGRLRQARREFRQACRYAPLCPLNWLYLAASCLPPPVLTAIRRAKHRLRKTPDGGRRRPEPEEGGRTR